MGRKKSDRGDVHPGRPHGDDRPNVGWQRQHDALFKTVVPRVRAIRRLVEEKLKLPKGSLAAMRQLQGEFRSRVVAEALHHKASWKVLQSDGIFETDDGLVVGFEYQSTNNKGMLLRTFMYALAFEEHDAFEASSRSPEFVVVYSGDDMSDEALKTLHGHFVERHVRYLFIDVNRIPAEELEDDSVQGRILRLSRRDATDIASFVAAARTIETSVHDRQERDNLTAALVAAAANKPHLLEGVLKEVNMSSVVRQSIEDAAPIWAHMQATRQFLAFLMQRHDAPLKLRAVVDEASGNELDRLRPLIEEACDVGDWSALSDTIERVSVPKP